MAEIVCGGRDEVREGGLARGGGGEVVRERKRKGGRRKKNLTFFLTPPKKQDAIRRLLERAAVPRPDQAHTGREDAEVRGGCGRRGRRVDVEEREEREAR